MSNVPLPQYQPLAWPPALPPAPNRSSRWLAIVSLGVALIAIGVAIGAWLRPLPKYEPPAAPSYSSQQVADAKAKVCAAYNEVHRAMLLSADRDGGTDPTAILAVATGGRQVLDAGSRYLLSTISESPATQPELKTAIQQLATAYQQLTIDYLSGLTNSDPKLDSSLRAADDATAVIERICG